MVASFLFWASLHSTCRLIMKFFTKLFVFIVFFINCGITHPSFTQVRLPLSKKEISLSFAPLVKKASPAVVNIYTKKVVKTRVSPFTDDPFFKQFFGENFNFGAPQNRVQNSLGSGVIVRPNGIVVTNYHVIEGANQITVVLSDRRELEGKLILADRRTDLAVLKLDTKGEMLPALKLRNSDELQVGDLVLAIGNPFGVGQTVTSGIVSALSRAAAGVSDFSFFIQTDAAINPGNSGGALVAMDGRLVGINTAIYSRSGGSQGIGFAIPSNMVERVIDSALEGTKILSPWFGAGGQQLTGRIALNLGLKRPVGIIINNIYPGGPADRAGMEVGDVVVSLDQKEVETPAALRFRIAILKPGDDVDLKVWRNGRFIKLKLPIEIAPEKPRKNLTRLRGRHPLSGAVIANMSPALAEELSIDPLTQGVIILEVGMRSPAKRLGLRPGDYLIKVNGKNVDRVLTAKRLFQKTQREWALSIRRDGEILSVVLR